MLRLARMNTPTRRLAIAAVGFIFLAQQAYATTFGCTPGFWKNHHDEWCGSFVSEDPAIDLTITPDTLLTDIYDNVPSELQNDSLDDALRYGGGNDLVEKKQILLRAAVAHLLNICHEDLGWDDIEGLSQADLLQLAIDQTNDALASTDKRDIVAEAERFDFLNNNQLPCPLPLNDD